VDIGRRWRAEQVGDGTEGGTEGFLVLLESLFVVLVRANGLGWIALQQVGCGWGLRHGHYRVIIIIIIIVIIIVIIVG
jgi:hypothetical protein